MKPGSLLICILALTANMSIAQSPPLRQIGLENGLPGLTVYQILQDTKGYIWMGTQNGICRFDGRQFKVWELDQLADKEIIYLQEDKFGRIWFHNLSMQVGKIEKEEVEVVFDNLKNTASDGSISAFGLTDSKLLLLRKKTMEDFFFRYELKEYGLRGRGMSAKRNIYGEGLMISFDRIFTDQEEAFSPTVFLQKGKEIRLGAKNGKLTNYAADDSIGYHGRKPLKVILQFIAPDSSKVYLDLSKIYISDKKGFRLFKDFKNVPVRSCKLIDGNLWVLTTSGISVFDYQTGQEKSAFLSGTACNMVCKDSENNFWIATSERGIYIIPNFNISVYKAADGLQKKEDVNSLLPSKDGQTLYVGTSGGEMTSVDLRDLSTRPLNTGYQGRVVSMEEGHRGMVWVGQDKWLSIFNPLDGGIISSNGFGGIKKVLVASEGQVFLARSHGVYKPEISYLNKWPIISVERPILNGRAYGLAEGGDGTVWIGSVDGLFLYQNNEVSPFLENGIHVKYKVSSVFYEPGKAVWVSTSDQGILKIVEHKVVKRWNAKNGMVSNNCTSVFKSGDIVLIGTDKGLVVNDERKGTFQVINNRSGLPGNSVRSVFMDEKNIWAGTSRGLVRIPFKAIQPNLTAPPVYITGLSVLGKDTALLPHYDFKFDQNTLDLNFTGIALKANGQERYKYRLKGLNDTWSFTDTRTARYHSLPSGNYTFQVSAINEEGVQSGRPATCSFTIATPWWKTTWFYTAAILGVMLLTGGVVYWRQNEKRKREQAENEWREKIKQLSLEALQNQMNPHFIFNALNAIQDYFIKKDYKSALFYLSKFAQMIRWIFDYSRQKAISLADEIEFLNLYLEIEKMRFGDRIEIDFEIEEDVHLMDEDFELPPLLIQPIIENCFKHGLMHKAEGGKLQLVFSTPRFNELHCKIVDNGVGREKARQLSAWRMSKNKHGSLTVIKERLHIFHNAESPPEEYLKVSDLIDEKGQPCGTTVDVFIYNKQLRTHAA